MQTNKENKVIREFGLSTLAVNNQTSVLIMLFIIVVTGTMAYINMPKENFPEIKMPKIFVSTTYPGNSPLDLENLVTRPIEKEIKTISGVTKINSTSIQDHSTIIVEFSFDTEVSDALQEVKDAVDRAKSELPTDLDSDPSVTELDVSEMPVLNIHISSVSAEMDELKFYAEYLQDRIEDLSEISKAELRGTREKEVKVVVDRFAMESLEISFRDIEEAIDFENRTISGGDILTDQFRRTLRIVGEFKSIEELENVVVKDKNLQVVFLKDIAEVSFDYEETKSYSRTMGVPVITLEVKKRSGENLLIATDKIKDIVAETVKDRVPDYITVDYSNDTSRMTRLQVANLENSIISGVILVVLVLLFFLGLRNSLFVGIAIPLSMLLGFLLLSTMGITMNIMVLFSLVLALGMLVDNGIVVVENIYRLMQEGKDGMTAAKEGVGEVAWPIISSTLTTLAAFLPLIFWDDLMGEFMKYLPMTLIIVLSSSLFVALVINPVLTSVFMKVQELDGPKKSRKNALLVLAGFFVLGLVMLFSGNTFYGNLFLIIVIVSLLNMYVLSPLSLKFQNIFLPRLERNYNKLIQYALHGWMPYLFFASMFVLFAFSVLLLMIRQPNLVTVPDNMPNYVNIFIELPSGTDIEKTNTISLKVDSIVVEALTDYLEDGNGLVESIITNVGQGTSDPNSVEIATGETPNKARITVSFVEFQFRDLGDKTTRDVMEELRSALAIVPGAKISLAKDPSGPPLGPPISVEVTGEDYETLIDLAEKIKAKIERSNIAGIEELKSDLDIGKPELIINIDRRASGRYGLSTAQIAGAIRTALFGKEVSKFKDGEDEYPIIVRLEDSYRYDLRSLLDQRITFRDQGSGKIRQVPISAVANVEYTTTYAAVNRKNLDRIITLYSNVLDGYNPKNIISKLAEVLDDYPMPDGYEIRYTGEIEEQEKSSAFLARAFTIAVFLIFLIIVSQFNSIASPLIIMFSVLFSTIGVLLGLAIFNMDFVVIMTGIGIISLAGVVVNNAIVLIDYTNLVRERKRKEIGSEGIRLPKNLIIESIIEGGQTRLRPVLLTAITTVLGLIPLAVGFNIDFNGLLTNYDPDIYIGGDNVVFWGPMSWTVIFGLTFATFLTLVIVPVMYLIFDRLSYRTAKFFGGTQ